MSKYLTSGPNRTRSTTASARRLERHRRQCRRRDHSRRWARGCASGRKASRASSPPGVPLRGARLPATSGRSTDTISTHLLPVLENVHDGDGGPVLVHVVTRKGQGLSRRLKLSADKCHAVTEFDVHYRHRRSSPRPTAPTYTKVFAKALDRRGRDATTRSSRSPRPCRRAPASIFSARLFPHRTLRRRRSPSSMPSTFAAGLACEGL